MTTQATTYGAPLSAILRESKPSLVGPTLARSPYYVVGIPLSEPLFDVPLMCHTPTQNTNNNLRAPFI